MGHNVRFWLAAVVGATMLGGCFDQLYGSPYDLERQRITRDTHNDLFPIAGGAHAGADCNTCHGAFDTFTQFDCTTCHEHAQAATDAAHAGFADYAYGPTTCFDCHPTGERMSRAQHDSFFPIETGRHGGLACVSCHPSGSNSFTCTDCHEHLCTSMNAKHSEVGNYSCTSTRCVACHPRGVAEDD